MPAAWAAEVWAAWEAEAEVWAAWEAEAAAGSFRLVAQNGNCPVGVEGLRLHASTLAAPPSQKQESHPRSP
jgi:hypothetical protein